MLSPSFPVAPSGWAVYVAAAPAGQPPAGPRRPLAFAPFLFLTPIHQALQQHGCPVLAFFLEDTAAGRTVAQLYVVLDYEALGQARSPGQASFGGVQLAAGLPAAVLHLLLDVAEATLRQHQQHRLEIRAYAACYDATGAATLTETLAQRGYQVTLAEENYHLATAREYEAHLHRSERRRLHRSRRAGFFVEQEPPFLLPAAYEFIAACRHERGQSLSLSLARVEVLFRALPQQHLLFSVRKPGGEWAALTIAIQVSEQVVYNLYHASLLRDNEWSPVVLLNEGLHTYARASGADAVDLGTSTIASVPNESLLHFKRYLGGVASPKLTWNKEL